MNDDLWLLFTVAEEVYDPNGPGELNKGEKLRFIVLEDVKGQTVTIWLESSPLDFEEFFPKARKVLDSVKWTGP